MSGDAREIDYDKMSLEEAEVLLSNAVYDAANIVERLEHADTKPGMFYSGKVSGNGHHVRQEIAAGAVKVLRERWRDREEVKE